MPKKNMGEARRPLRRGAARAGRAGRSFRCLARHGLDMSYRDDRSTLESRRDDLEQKLRDLEPRALELEALGRERAAIEAELAAVRVRLAQAAARRLPLLDDVRVASPCDASWEAMKGDARVRFCEACEKQVYNLSAMPRLDAERLIAEHEGSVCIRLYRRTDGTVLTADCPVGLKRVRMRRVRRVIFAAAGLGALGLFAATQYRPATKMMMGEMTEQPAPVMGGTGAVPAPPPPSALPTAAPSTAGTVPCDSDAAPVMGKMAPPPSAKAAAPADPRQRR